MIFDIDKIQKNYKIEPVDTSTMGEYLSWSTQFFHNKESCAYPLLSLTFPLDITALRRQYEDDYLEGASFTSYLMWKICKTIQTFPDLLLRNINGKWYKLADPAVYSPIGIGGAKRFRTVFIKSPGLLSWADFHNEYQKQMQKAQSGEGKLTVTEEDFHISTMVGNLPNFKFSSFQFHQFPQSTGRQLFYLGQRYEERGRMFIPMSATIDHGNADPYILDKFVKALTNET